MNSSHHALPVLYHVDEKLCGHLVFRLASRAVPIYEKNGWGESFRVSRWNETKEHRPGTEAFDKRKNQTTTLFVHSIDSVLDRVERKNTQHLPNYSVASAHLHPICSRLSCFILLECIPNRVTLFFFLFFNKHIRKTHTPPFLYRYYFPFFFARILLKILFTCGVQLENR